MTEEIKLTRKQKESIIILCVIVFSIGMFIGIALEVYDPLKLKTQDDCRYGFNFEKSRCLTESEYMTEINNFKKDYEKGKTMTLEQVCSSVSHDSDFYQKYCLGE